MEWRKFRQELIFVVYISCSRWNARHFVHQKYDGEPDESQYFWVCKAEEEGDQDSLGRCGDARYHLGNDDNDDNCDDFEDDNCDGHGDNYDGYDDNHDGYDDNCDDDYDYDYEGYDDKYDDNYEDHDDDRQPHRCTQVWILLQGGLAEAESELQRLVSGSRPCVISF